MDSCLCCGDWADFGITEVHFDTRELVLHSCCEENLSGWLDTIRAWSREERSEWVRFETAIYVRDILVEGDVLRWTLDYGLHLEKVFFADAKEFIREHHRHCKAPVGWKYGSAVFNGREMVGVMTAGDRCRRSWQGRVALK